MKLQQKQQKLLIQLREITKDNASIKKKEQDTTKKDHVENQKELWEN